MHVGIIYIGMRTAAGEGAWGSRPDASVRDEGRPVLWLPRALPWLPRALAWLPRLLPCLSLVRLLGRLDRFSFCSPLFCSVQHK